MAEENINGILVIQTLKSSKQPMTMPMIVRTIAKVINADETAVADIVEDTVEIGHAYGFLEESNGHYSLPKKLTDNSAEVGNDKELDQSQPRELFCTPPIPQNTFGRRSRDDDEEYDCSSVTDEDASTEYDCSSDEFNTDDEMFIAQILSDDFVDVIEAPGINCDSLSRGRGKRFNVNGKRNRSPNRRRSKSPSYALNPPKRRRM